MGEEPRDDAAPPHPTAGEPATGEPTTRPAGNRPDPAREDATRPDPARQDPARHHATSHDATSHEATSHDPAAGGGPLTPAAPARWSGAAPVPPPAPRRRWWRRRPAAAGSAPAAEDEWTILPAVDPWADQAPPWQDTPPLTTAPFPAPPPTLFDAPAAPPPPQPDRPMPNATPAAPPPPHPDRPMPKTGPAAPPPPQPDRPMPNSRPAPPQPNRPMPKTGPAAPAPGQANRPMPKTPAPAGRPGPPPAAPAPRRRTRRRRRLLLFTLVSGVLCCGLPGYFAWPAAQQYPVSAALPQTVADLALRDDGAARRAADRLARQVAAGGAGPVFAGVYADGYGKRVTIAGTTGLRLTPEQDVETELNRLAAAYDLTRVGAYDLGEAGAHERCGVGRAGGTGVVVCGWADHGSLATVVLTRRSVGESAHLVAVLRGAVLSPR
jgi:hypothetical protein